MAQLDQSVIWTFTLVDQVIPTTERMISSIEQTQDAVQQLDEKTNSIAQDADQAKGATNQLAASTQEVAAANEQLAQKTKEATGAQQGQTLEFLKQMTAVTALSAGFNRLSSGLSTLGLISDEDAAKMQKLTAAIGLVVGAFQLIKGAVAVVNILRSSEIALAAVETYRSVINKGPLAIAGVAAGIGIATGAAAYMIGQSGGGSSSNTEVTQNITYAGGSSSSQRANNREILEVMG